VFARPRTDYQHLHVVSCLLMNFVNRKR